MSKHEESQNVRVLNYMLAYKTINRRIASRKLRVERLASRIYDLRQMGYPITKVEKYGKNQYGPFHYSQYTLEV